MDDIEIESHRTGSIGPPVNGTAHVANTNPEAVSLEQDGPEVEDRPEYLRYVSYPQTYLERALV
jgi:hypothetical protein